MESNNTNEKTLLTVEEVVKLLGFASIPTIKKWSAQGKFPRPKKFMKLSRWLKSDVESWLADKIESQSGSL